MPAEPQLRRATDQGRRRGAALLACGAVAFATLIADPAFAADAAERLRPALGNTIVSTHPDGRKARLWLTPGGRYSAEGRAGQRSGGVWTIKGEKLCLKQRRPISMPFTYCKPIPSVALDRPWRDKAVTGEMVTNNVVPGGDPRETR